MALSPSVGGVVTDSIYRYRRPPRPIEARPQDQQRTRRALRGAPPVTPGAARLKNSPLVATLAGLFSNRRIPACPDGSLFIAMRFSP